MELQHSHSLDINKSSPSSFMKLSHIVWPEPTEAYNKMASILKMTEDFVIFIEIYFPMVE